jgi:GT2 family glycosyltransferase
MMHELAGVVFPKDGFVFFKDLFFRSWDEFLIIDKQYVKANVCQFDTWLNMFAAKKWYKYCDLGELYLQLNIKGNYRLGITGNGFSHAFNVSSTVLADQYVDGGPVTVHIPGAEKYEGIYFSVFSSTSDTPPEFCSAAWCTDKAPKYNNKLALVSCTFKREAYITRTIGKLETFIKENPALRDKIHFFVVDNGKTLDTDTTYGNTTVIPNMNAGGAGGFTRGLMEVIKSRKGYTRVLFMDDDIEIIPESFYRTLMIADYLREEYKDSFINGAMMDLYAKHIMSENLAVKNKFWVKPYITKDVNVCSNVLQVNNIPEELFAGEKVFSGWWYNCFPVSFVDGKGLPLPFFIRCDDMEWGWRHAGRHHISMNGICVWHEPFSWKVPPLTEYYYSIRNAFMVWTLYDKSFKEKFEVYLKDFFYLCLLNVYRYEDIKIFLRALDDILAGSEAFRENPEKQYKELCALLKKPEYVTATADDLEKVKGYYPAMFKRKIVYYFTCRGKYWPLFLFKKNSMALEWFPPVENFMLCKEVKVFNLLTGKYCVRKYDRKLAAYYEKAFKSRLKKIKAKFDCLRGDYTEAHKEFTGFDFWVKYLELEE